MEDFETMERIFSASNALASVTRYASPYRRRLFIDTFFRQWDDDKYENLGTFLFNNYRQACATLDQDIPALEDAMRKFKITDIDLDQWEKEEAEFFTQLGKEPETNTLRVEYVELLQVLQSARVERKNSNSFYLGHLSVITETPQSTQYYKSASDTNKLEQRRRLARERFDIAHADVVQMEIRLGIDRRWEPTDTEYLETMKYMNNHKYHRALDKLHQLVVLRLFELHRMNLSGTGRDFVCFYFIAPTDPGYPLIGYKLRTHMAKSLQTRSKTIRKAIKDYNTAAAAVVPPRPALDWSDVSHYGLVEHYAILKANNTDVSTKQWAQPIYREILKCRRRIARAKEEVTRCNVEVRRLHTGILDDAIHFRTVVRKLKEDGKRMMRMRKQIRNKSKIRS